MANGDLEKTRAGLEIDIGGLPSKTAEQDAVKALSNQVLKNVQKLTYDSKCELVQQLVERIVVRDQELEIHTVFPPAEAAVALRDVPGVDCPAKQTGVLLRKGLIDPSKYVRITLFADLPPSPQAERWKRKKAAEAKRLRQVA